jgi:hypothetical protein
MGGTTDRPVIDGLVIPRDAGRGRQSTIFRRSLSGHSLWAKKVCF